ncbi:type II secretion system F family protein [Solirubrobacter sp. CPCC 204708]|uniref:Type II secretion system F family protein n=1 Tax=Solirubrobacter deserti TaxID=2282478 RepID=A0ABT4RDV3_9ACTN|nr:type II secretion system F family protein [Solirubrobacter deserti]MBE2314685.1 type II secretion system F family protein [Solirubrobacter deserti]MDA0136693.1 type II secretion system F family protein [Solirubrobacter deserti]
MTSLLAGLAAALATFALADLAPRTRRRPLTRVIATLGARSGVKPSSGLAARIQAAGLDRHTHEVVALQAGLAILTTLTALPLITAAPGRLGLALLVAAPLAGFALPEVGLRRRVRQRRAEIEAELPDVLDLVRVAIAAGLAPRRALEEVGRRHPGTLARELTRLAARTQLGEPVDAALDHLQQRCPSHTIPPFVAALRRAERHGTPLQPTLSAQATQARSQRAARRSEQAAKAAPKIQLVVALMLVPAVLLLIAAALVPSLGA